MPINSVKRVVIVTLDRLWRIASFASFTSNLPAVDIDNSLGKTRFSRYIRVFPITDNST